MEGIEKIRLSNKVVVVYVDNGKNIMRTYKNGIKVETELTDTDIQSLEAIGTKIVKVKYVGKPEWKSY